MISSTFEACKNNLRETTHYDHPINEWIDLHVHSTCSDGTIDPEDLPEVVLDTVRRHGHGERFCRYLLALTDHDTLSGVKRLLSVAESYPEFHIIPGVEISCDYKGNTIHMLGLDIDPGNQKLIDRLSYLCTSRDARNMAIVEKFKELGIAMNIEEIAAEDGGAIGRPHIARWLLEHGCVTSVSEAFDLYLKKGRPCYVDREKISIEEAVELILQAGGHPALAHPMKYKRLSPAELEEMVAHLKTLGMWGIETYYTNFSREQVAAIEVLADRYGLVKTGGSDYHGDNKPDIEIGYGWGNLDETMPQIEYR